MGNAIEGSASKGGRCVLSTAIVLRGRFSDPLRISARVNEKREAYQPPNRGINIARSGPFHVRILNSVGRETEEEEGTGAPCVCACRTLESYRFHRPPERDEGGRARIRRNIERCSVPSYPTRIIVCNWHIHLGEAFILRTYTYLRTDRDCLLFISFTISIPQRYIY